MVSYSPKERRDEDESTVPHKGDAPTAVAIPPLHMMTDMKAVAGRCMLLLWPES